MDDKQFGQLLEFFALSWSGYRRVRKGVKKRVRRHMQELGCRDVEEYIERISRSEVIKAECELLMSVSISRFFRDQKLWEFLKEQILPEIIGTGQDKIKVWSAGCACGEEVYSLKIVWELVQGSNHKRTEMEITATDLNPVNLQRAKDGIYPPSSLKEVPLDLRNSFFQAQRGGKRFRIEPALKSGIVWVERDIFAGPPGAGYQLIFARNNLLTYFQKERILPAMDQIFESLAAGGSLIIGSDEKLPMQTAVLKPRAALPYVFKKRT